MGGCMGRSGCRDGWVGVGVVVVVGMDRWVYW